jgi:hypothetical protein
MAVLLLNADRLLERVAFDVLNQSPVERGKRHEPASRLARYPLDPKNTLW